MSEKESYELGRMDALLFWSAGQSPSCVFRHVPPFDGLSLAAYRRGVASFIIAEGT